MRSITRATSIRFTSERIEREQCRQGKLSDLLKKMGQTAFFLQHRVTTIKDVRDEKRGESLFFQIMSVGRPTPSRIAPWSRRISGYPRKVSKARRTNWRVKSPPAPRSRSKEIAPGSR